MARDSLRVTRLPFTPLATHRISATTYPGTRTDGNSKEKTPTSCPPNWCWKRTRFPAFVRILVQFIFPFNTPSNAAWDYRYGELALLLPNTDLEIIFFGPGVTAILQRARGRPSCLANEENPYEYTAPTVSGGGTMKISLSEEGSFWGANRRRRSRHPAPDALIACNAGLGAYPN